MNIDFVITIGKLLIDLKVKTIEPKVEITGSLNSEKSS